MNPNTTPYHIHYGSKPYPVNVPEGWKVILNDLPGDISGTAPSVPEMVARALDLPVASPPLSRLVNGRSRVTVIVDDGARATPVSRVLPTVLAALARAGVGPDAVDILVALGTHRPMGEGALAERLGGGITGAFRVTQHDSKAADLVPVGRLSTGGEVRVNPLVARADVTIGIGSIVPHVMNGFGGGPKILMPGVCNYEAIKEHHLHHTPTPACYVGNLDSNPFYEEVCRVADQAGLTFIVNCVYNAREDVVGVVAGNVRKAHQAGVEMSIANYAFHLEEQADVTITSAYPYNEGPQIIKPIVPAALLATKPGGEVIMAAASKEPMPEPMLGAFDSIYSRSPSHPGRFAVDTFAASRLFVDGAIDFNCAIYFALVCAGRTAVTIVSDDLTPESIRRLGFHHAGSLEEAIALAHKRRPVASVNIFPVGGLVLPLTDSPPELFGERPA